MTTYASFIAELRRQRRDDHRLYHQSRINQTLHLVSAVSFLIAYALVYFDPLLAVLIGWCVGMVTRQTGHYVFEPNRFDGRNRLSNVEKESIKVGFNQMRKTVLIALVLLGPALLVVDPTLFGAFHRHTNWHDLARHVAMIWLFLAVAAIVLRCLQLCFTRNVLTGLVWVFKIATDPVHNIHIYWKSPLYLLRGQLYDPLDEIDLSAAASGHS